jgi:hypothetical protein
MTYAVSAIKRRFGDDFFEIAELAWGAADLQVAVLPYDGDARGIVATIFELAQAFYDNRHNLLGPDIADYSAHARCLLIAFLEA